MGEVVREFSVKLLKPQLVKGLLGILHRVVRLLHVLS